MSGSTSLNLSSLQVRVEEDFSQICCSCVSLVGVARKKEYGEVEKGRDLATRQRDQMIVEVSLVALSS